MDVIVINGGTQRWKWTRYDTLTGVPQITTVFFSDIQNEAMLLGSSNSSFKMDEASLNINGKGEQPVFKKSSLTPGEIKENSAHCFTEGAASTSRNWDERPTIDHQIEFIHSHRHTFSGFDDLTYLAIEESLKSIKRWNESPAYHGKIDVEKVIEDLLKKLKLSAQRDKHVPDGGERYDDVIQNAEAALGMLQAFKQERTITPQDVADAHHAGKNILDKKKSEQGWPPHGQMQEVLKKMHPYIPQKERDGLIQTVSYLLPLHFAFADKGTIPDNIKIANAIIYAIEQMDRLRMA